MPRPGGLPGLLTEMVTGIQRPNLSFLFHKVSLSSQLLPVWMRSSSAKSSSEQSQEPELYGELTQHAAWKDTEKVSLPEMPWDESSHSATDSMRPLSRPMTPCASVSPSRLRNKTVVA